MLGTWKLEKAARRELPNRKPILTDGYINIILSFVRFTTRRRLQFQTRRKRMVTATRMAATGNATIITITALQINSQNLQHVSLAEFWFSISREPLIVVHHYLTTTKLLCRNGIVTNMLNLLRYGDSGLSKTFSSLSLRH